MRGLDIAGVLRKGRSRQHTRTGWIQAPRQDFVASGGEIWGVAAGEDTWI